MDIELYHNTIMVAEQQYYSQGQTIFSSLLILQNRKKIYCSFQHEIIDKFTYVARIPMTGI